MPTAEYYRKNKKKLKEYNKNWRGENKEKLNEYDKNYRKENKESLKEYNKNWREENKENLDEYHTNYRNNNRKEIFAQHCISNLIKDSTTPFIREDCAFCNKESFDCHHENYDLPFVFYFLCRSCHMSYHRSRKDKA